MAIEVMVKMTVELKTVQLSICDIAYDRVNDRADDRVSYDSILQHSEL